MKLRSLVLAIAAALAPACSSSATPAPHAVGPLSNPAAFAQPGAMQVAAPAQAPGQGGAFDAADARAFHAALVFSLQQVGRADVAAQLSERDVTAALVRAYPSANPQARSALDTASETWPQLQAAWPSMSLEQKRELVYTVLAIGVGEQAAGQLVGAAASQGQGGSRRGGGGGGGGSFDVNVDYEGSNCWGSAGCTGYEADGGGTYTFEEPSIPME